ncbi:NAD-dependent epimerase/dehydratase family protein [Mycolicibacterium sediminis]|uniref:Oxidoreductase n=1 Tax=Mycolicibacterium sediminis TaxID=1286180 RepID=A0A7I7QKU3_9MYCO|nr:NAD-dependent epimerase/dehydratase family protein [Mycolicibacterium sediminis]BBY26968.1 oxidoreductase [Mycolicibacterium sediminis]
MTGAPPRILVTGATGTVGSLVCGELTETGAVVVAAARSAATRFDWYDRESWGPALDGVTAVYLVAPSNDPAPETVMRPFLDLALASGVTRAVLQSSSLIESGGPTLGVVHAAVAETFPEWAVLRPSWFMQNFSGRHPHAESIRSSGVLTTATGGGSVGFIDARDIARVAAHALTSDVALNSDPILTGPAALSYDDVAKVIAHASGHPVAHVAIDVDQIRRIYTADGMPPDYAGMLAGLDALIADGAEDRVTDSVLRLTGVAPRSFEEFAAGIDWRVGSDVAIP